MTRKANALFEHQPNCGLVKRLMKTNKTIEELIKELEGKPTIEQRAKAYSKTQAIECYAYCGYEIGATEQRQIDIENCVKWCENFNKEAEKTGCIERIDVDSFRKWITNMIMNDEQY